MDLNSSSTYIEYQCAEQAESIWHEDSIEEGNVLETENNASISNCTEKHAKPINKTLSLSSDCANKQSPESSLLFELERHLNALKAQEPWPKDVKLYQPYEVEQILLPDNANCLSVQAFLKMCNLDFQVEPRSNAEFMSPTGRVPFIKAGAFVVAEFEGIVQFVNGKGISLTTDLEPEQKSDMRAYMSLVHNVLENAEVGGQFVAPRLYICWCDNETYKEVTKPRNGSIYPWPLNYIETWSKRSQVIKRLKLLGWYNKTLQEVYNEVDMCCQALTDRLEGKEYFFGNKFSDLDALVYGHVKTLLSFPIPTKNYSFQALVKHHKDLVKHCRNVDQRVMGLEKKNMTKFARSINSISRSLSEAWYPKNSLSLTKVGPEGDTDTESSWESIREEVF